MKYLADIVKNQAQANAVCKELTESIGKVLDKIGWKDKFFYECYSIVAQANFGDYEQLAIEFRYEDPNKTMHRITGTFRLDGIRIAAYRGQQLEDIIHHELNNVVYETALKMLEKQGTNYPAEQKKRHEEWVAKMDRDDEEHKNWATRINPEEVLESNRLLEKLKHKPMIRLRAEWSFS